MEYLVKENDNKDNFGMVITLEHTCPTDNCGGGATECPRLGCCPRGGRAVPPWEI